MSVALKPAVIADRPKFKTFPPKHVIEDFLRHVRETGKPDLWGCHDPSQPPADGDFEIIRDFGVPESLRASVGRASCPICSPSFPKYYEGALAWFPEEGALRAIGNECARSHFGASRYNKAVADGQRRLAIESAQDFLLEALPQVTGLRSQVETLLTPAKAADHIRNAIRRLISLQACKALSRKGARGFLELEEQEQVTTVDSFGREKTSLVSRVVETVHVAGISFLSERFLTQAKVENSLVALDQLPSGDEEAALNFIVEHLRDPMHLFEAERITRATVEGVADIHRALEDAREFLAPANLSAISGWTADPRSGSAVHFEFNECRPEQLYARGSRGSGSFVKVHRELWG